MKMNERIIRMLDWPCQQLERLRDWLEEGHHAIYDAPRETNPADGGSATYSVKNADGQEMPFVYGYDTRKPPVKGFKLPGD